MRHVQRDMVGVSVFDLKVGDRVVVVGSDVFDVLAIGRNGTVTEIRPKGTRVEIAVMLDYIKGYGVPYIYWPETLEKVE